MKKYVLILASIILYSFTCFAQEREVYAPGIDGPIYKDSIVEEKTNVIKIESVKVQPENPPQEIVNVVVNPAPAPIQTMMTVNQLPFGGVREDGLTWGLNRLTHIMTKNGTTAAINSIQELPKKEGETLIKQSFLVNVSSNNTWRNGNWQIDIYPIDEQYRKVLEGYSSFFGYYDKDKMFIGVAQAKKV